MHFWNHVCFWACCIKACVSRSIIPGEAPLSLLLSDGTKKKQPEDPDVVRKRIEREIEEQMHVHATQNNSRTNTSRGSLSNHLRAIQNIFESEASSTSGYTVQPLKDKAVDDTAGMSATKTLGTLKEEPVVAGETAAGSNPDVVQKVKREIEERLRASHDSSRGETPSESLTTSLPSTGNATTTLTKPLTAMATTTATLSTTLTAMATTTATSSTTLTTIPPLSSDEKDALLKAFQEAPKRKMLHIPTAEEALQHWKERRKTTTTTTSTTITTTSSAITTMTATLTVITSSTTSTTIPPLSSDENDALLKAFQEAPKRKMLRIPTAEEALQHWKERRKTTTTTTSTTITIRSTTLMTIPSTTTTSTTTTTILPLSKDQKEAVLKVFEEQPKRKMLSIPLAEASKENAIHPRFSSAKQALSSSYQNGRRKSAVRQKNQTLQHSQERQCKKKLNVTRALPLIPNGTDRVLFFWAVGAEDRVVRLVMENIAHARQQLPSMDVYLAHYDARQDLWVKREQEWYRRNVDFSSDSSGYKFQMMQRVLSGKDPFAPNLSKYAWVWALDEDVDFTKTNLTRLFELAKDSGSLLGLPTFTELDGNGAEKNLNYPMQMPQAGCSFRYTPVVEVIFPFIRPAVLNALFHDCKDCIHEKSVWGLDRIWCSWSARTFHTNPRQACVLIDETPVVHRNFKTLRDKYIVSGSREMFPGFMDQALADFHDVQKHHRSDFVEGAAAEMRASACVVQRFHRGRARLGKLLDALPKIAL